MLEILLNSLSSPIVLSFVLGVFATLVRSDLKFPDSLYQSLTIYLLFAIGIKGGVKLSSSSFEEVYKIGLAAILMSSMIPVWVYLILRYLAKFDSINSAAMAAHFGSVSVVTFSQTSVYLEQKGISFEGFMPAMLAIMEVPAIMIAIFIARKNSGTSGESGSKIMHELLTGKGSLLLTGGLIIGMITGKKGFEQVSPFFEIPFKGILCLFLLEVGLVTGRRISDLKKVGFKLIFFGILIPVLNGLIGACLATWAGLGVGGTTLF
ncbi:MAG: sodium-dependent bicarbonate transport family permease, partial [Bacteroidia bacterium]